MQNMVSMVVKGASFLKADNRASYALAFLLVVIGLALAVLLQH